MGTKEGDGIVSRLLQEKAVVSKIAALADVVLLGKRKGKRWWVGTEYGRGSVLEHGGESGGDYGRGNDMERGKGRHGEVGYKGKGYEEDWKNSRSSYAKVNVKRDHGSRQDMLGEPPANPILFIV